MKLTAAQREAMKTLADEGGIDRPDATALKIEVDIYHGRNRGLIVAEVEFPNHASRRKFKAPRWFGREVTGEKRYSNVRLARE